MQPSSHRTLEATAAAAPAVAALSLDDRLACAQRSREYLVADGPGIVESVICEAGIPRKFAERELISALSLIDALPGFAEAIRPRAIPARSGHTTLHWMPFGVVLGLHSANSPIWVPTVVAISSLVAGNAVVCRPSRAVGTTTMRVLAAFAAAWPSDAVGVVECAPSEVAELLVAPQIDAIVAHAATQTCRAHLGALAEGYARGVVLRPYIPEASGNDALIVLPGADLVQAAEGIALGAFANAGQLCFSAKRIIVDDRIWPALAPYVRDAVAALVIGDPDDHATDLAMVSAFVEAAEAAYLQARDAGAEQITGWVSTDETIGRTNPRLMLLPRERLAELALWQTEIFAPIRGVVLARDCQDACALAADTQFGIGVSIFGGTADDHELICRRVRSARVLINESPLYQDPHMVVGGIRNSGYGGARPKLEQLVYARRIHTS